VNRKNADVVCREAPHSECATEGSDARISTFGVLHEHAIGGEHVLLLTICLSLEVGEAAGEEIWIDGFALGIAEFYFLLELFLLEGKPISDLLAAEGNLTSTVADVEDRRWVFGVDFASNSKRTATRGGDRATGFVTAKQSGAVNRWGKGKLTST
jgi:hypothetical protein